MGINSRLAAAFAAIDAPVEQDSAPISEANAPVEQDSAPVHRTTFEPVNEAATDPVRKTLNVKRLDEKAVLVQVRRRMYSPYKLDTAESVAYGAGNVNKHLFQGANNRVKRTISRFSDVYTYVKNNTVPWSTGIDLLNMAHYMEFTSSLRRLIDDANHAVDDLVANWDTEVQADLKRLANIANQKGKPNLADPSDYPDADTLRSRFSIDVQYMPVPKADHFDPRFGLSDEDVATLEDRLNEAEANAATHVLKTLIEPMQRGAEKLAVPIGDDGSIFRDSLIDNMVEVAERMNKVNMSNDPQVQKSINELRSLASVYASNKDVLRSSQSVREKAASQISDLVNQMSGLV